MAQIATTSIFNPSDNLSTEEQLIMKSNNYELYQNEYRIYIQKKYSTWFVKDLKTKSRKETMYLARKNAYDSLRNSFDLNRSFIENKGDVEKLKEDIDNLFWAKFRSQFPTYDAYHNYPNCYKNTPYQSYRQNTIYIFNKKKAQEQEDKARGLQKRILREQELRAKIGDKEFNRRMIQDKLEKSKKGGSDNEYLEYLEWKDTFEGNQYTAGFGEQSKQINHIDSRVYLQKINGIHFTNIKYFRVTKYVFDAVLLEVLTNHKQFRVNMTLTEGKTLDEIPTQHVIFNNGIRDIVSAERKSVLRGTILKWYIKQSTLYVCFDSMPGNYHRVYPKKWAKFENYSDPETGEFVGNPKHKSLAHKFYKVCGELITIDLFYNKHKYSITTSRNGVLHTKDEIMKSITENKTEDRIKSRLQDKIKKDKQARAINHKSNNKKNAESDIRRVQFQKASDLYMEGTITKEQFNEMLEKYKL